MRRAALCLHLSECVSPDIAGRIADMCNHAHGVISTKNSDGWWFRREGEDRAFVSVSDEEYACLASDVALAGKRLTVITPDGDGLLMRSFCGGVLDDEPPHLPAVVCVTETELTTESWSQGVQSASSDVDDVSAHRR